MTTENTPPAPSPAPIPSPSPTVAEKPWWETRIDSLTREKYEQADRISKLESAIEGLKKASSIPAPTLAPELNKKPINMTQEEFDRAVQEKAEIRKNEEAFNSACNKVYNDGKSAYSDFDDSLKSFTKLGGIPVPTAQIVIDMDNPSEILYQLSKNLDRAAEIFKLSPAKQALALAKYSAEIEKEAREAKKANPAVIKPVVGGNRTISEPDPEKMSMTEFIAWREKQKA